MYINLIRGWIFLLDTSGGNLFSKIHIGWVFLCIGCSNLLKKTYIGWYGDSPWALVVLEMKTWRGPPDSVIISYTRQTEEGTSYSVRQNKEHLSCFQLLQHQQSTKILLQKFCPLLTVENCSFSLRLVWGVDSVRTLSQFGLGRQRKSFLPTFGLCRLSV